MRKNELPTHPILALAESRLIATEPTTRPVVEGVISAMNNQLINNWRVTTVSEGRVTIPHTSLSTKAIPGFPPTERMQVYVTFTGIAGQVGDRLDTVTSSLFQKYAEARQTAAKGEEPIATEFILLGCPTSVGGKVTKEWNQMMSKDGPSLFGQAAAEILEHPLRKDTVEYVVYNGLSKGARTATDTLIQFPEYTGRRRLVQDHAPRNMWNATVGFPIEIGLGRFRKWKMEQGLLPHQSESDFITTNAEQFAEELDVFDSKDQKVLKAKAALRDWIHTKYPHTEIPKDVDLTEIHGLFDLTHISLGSLVWLLKDVRTRGEVTKVKGKETKIFDLSMHSGFPFPEAVVKKMVAALENS